MNETADKIARAFVQVLSEWLTPGEMREVRRRNATPEYGKACASHDFCDANMAMEPAFTAVMGHAPAFAPEVDDPDYDRLVAEADAESALWNEAWNIAKSRDLTATPDEVAEDSDYPGTVYCGYDAKPIDLVRDAAEYVTPSCTRSYCHCSEFTFCDTDCFDAYHKHQVAA